MAAKTVFDAFPNGVISNQWKLGTVKKGTITGNQFAEPEEFMDVIISEVYRQTIKPTVSDGVQMDTDTLIYAKPEQLPTTNLQAYEGDYLWYDTINGLYFAIIRASAGFNQQTGIMEHVEFIVRPTSVVGA